jgi:Immunoglobulin I-set domain
MYKRGKLTRSPCILWILFFFRVHGRCFCGFDSSTSGFFLRSTLTNRFLRPKLDRQIDGLAPTFLKKPAIRQEDDGKRLLFECVIKADPVPAVKWQHNASPVNDNDRHKVRPVHAVELTNH